MMNARLCSAVLLLCGLTVVGCASEKISNNPPPNQPSATVPASTPNLLIARVPVADLTDKSQVSADFASSSQSSANVSDGDSAASAYGDGQAIKLEQPSTSDSGSSLALGGVVSSGTSYGYSSGGSYGSCGCGWNFPIINGILGAISDVGSLIFGYGYGYNGGYGYRNTGYGTTGYATTTVVAGTYTNGTYTNGTYTNGQTIPFGTNTTYSNPNYVWSPNGPTYNNPTYNPFPVTGITVGATYSTGIPGCTPSVYNQTNGWVASATATDPYAPLCNGQPAPSGIGPVVGTAYTTGVTSCTPSTYGTSGWVATGTPAYSGAPLCDGNVYASVTGSGGAINNQMPNFAPTYSSNGTNYTYQYSGAYDSNGYRYYVYKTK